MENFRVAPMAKVIIWHARDGVWSCGGGDVKAPLANSRINWVCDSPPSQSHHIAPRQTLPKNKIHQSHDKKTRSNNSVPRNVYSPPSRQGKESTETPIAPSSDVRV